MRLIVGWSWSKHAWVVALWVHHPRRLLRIPWRVVAWPMLLLHVPVVEVVSIMEVVSSASASTTIASVVGVS